MRTAWITLGRYGDIINTLPLVLDDFQRGNKPTFVTSKPWADILDGVSYCDRLSLDLEYHRPVDAMRQVHSSGKFDQIYLCQCYGTSHEMLCANFAEESWRLIGKHEKWNKLPLIFDRRSQEREDQLLLKIGRRNKPFILVSSDGVSSPFPHKEKLTQILKPLEHRYDFIDLSGFRAKKFYDLIALYEQAAGLITTDTGTLHLAQATPSLPVIALVTHSPTMWHGSPRRENHVLRIRYNEFPARCNEIADLLENPMRLCQPLLIHVWNDYSRTGDASRRHATAKLTWAAEYDRAPWRPLPVHDSKFNRNTKTVCGDAKAVPFVNDLLDRAAEFGSPNDLIILTNDDTVFVENISEKITRLSADGPFWGSRMEHTRIAHQPNEKTIMLNAYKHCGADIFVFTKRWWIANRLEMPLMGLSFEAWDLVLRCLISERGGRSIDGLVAHEIHQPYWHSSKNRECAGNLFNRDAARKFFSTRGGWPKV